ncbi:MAG: glucokinase [Desulforhopalus sp.]
MITLFAADIGGTKSELAIFPLAGSDSKALLQKRYSNAEFSGIEEIIEKFLAEADLLPQFGCLAVAGVVSDDRAQLTNLPWRVDCRLLEKRFGFHRVILINDLTAVCSSLFMLGKVDLLEIQSADGHGEVRGVVAPGTGLGEGLLVEFGGKVYARGSEGGHSDFAPVDEEQLALLGWMQKKMQPVSYEALIAGPGLANIYDFYKEYHQMKESPWIVEAMHQAKDRIPVIVGGVTGKIGGKTCPLCRRVIDLFLSILGSEAGNLALKLYAKGGIYLGGGILPRLVKHVTFDGFLKSFQAKGQMSGLMKEIPVYLILRKDAALIGTVSFARQELKEWNSDE